MERDIDAFRQTLSSYLRSSREELSLFLVAFCTKVDTKQIGRLLALFDVNMNPEDRETCPKAIELFVNEDMFLHFLTELCVNDYVLYRDKTQTSPRQRDLIKFNWIKAARAYLYDKKAALYTEKKERLLARSYHPHVIPHKRKWGNYAFALLFLATLAFILVIPAIREEYDTLSVLNLDVSAVIPRWNGLEAEGSGSARLSSGLAAVSTELNAIVKRVMTYYDKTLESDQVRIYV